MLLPSNQELEERLGAAGRSLLQPPSTLDELLTLLDHIEELLSKVAQSPPASLQTALSPLTKSLVSEELMEHSNVDVQVGVAACISEITRITAPEAPYDDDKMKDVFQLIVSSFDKLSDTSSRSYQKRATILETVSKVRSCVIMLDLELDQMIIEMFQHLLKSIRVYHGEAIFTSMETVMTLVLEESEYISVDLLTPVLDVLKKNNEEVLPIAKKLAEKVIQNGADKLGPCLAKAVNTLNASLDDYSEVIASVCQKNSSSSGHSDENILKDESASMDVKEEIRQQDKDPSEDVKEEIKPQEKDPTLNGSSRSIACNSVKETGDEETVTDENILKEAKFKQQSDSKSAPETESNDVDAEKPAQLEDKVEHVANGEATPFNNRNNSAESSDLIDDEKQEEKAPCHEEIPSEEVHTSPGDSPSIVANKTSDTVKGPTVRPSPVKEAEVEAVEVASPIERGCLPSESQPESSGRTKRKENMVKEVTSSMKALEGSNMAEVNKKPRTKKHGATTNTVKATNVGVSKNDATTMSDSETRNLSSEKLGDVNNKKDDEGSNMAEANKKKRTMKKQHGVTTSKDMAKNVGVSKNDASSMSDSETRNLSSEKLADVSDKKDNKSLRNEFGRKGGRGKPKSMKDTSKYSSAEDNEKDTEASLLSPEKSAEDEGSQEESPKTGTKRKRAPGTDNTPQTIRYGKNLVGSKVKVWWPEDETFYEGVIKSYNPGKKRHKVLYDDGEIEHLILRKERWEFVGDDSDSDGGRSAELPVQDASSNKKMKKGQTSNKNEKTLDAPKRKPKGNANKSGSKSKDAIRAEPESTENSENETDKSDDHSEELEADSPNLSSKATGKSRDGGVAKTSSQKKQETQRSTNSKGKTAQTKGKTPQSGKNASPVGKGVKKSSSSKAKETVRVEKAMNPEKSLDTVKGGKSGESGNKTGKKRRK